MVNFTFILWGIIMILLVLFIMLLTAKKDNNSENTAITDDVQIKMSYVKLNNSLEWMYQMGVIDSMEYNRLKNDSMMFLNK